MNKKQLSVLAVLILNTGALSACFAEKHVIAVKKTPQKGYYLTVDRKPFLIKGVIYNPVPIGEGYNYDLTADCNKPWLTDGKLMKEAGINCIRLYSAGKDLEKTRTFIRDMYERFGIYTIVSDWLGLWTFPSANYADKEARRQTKEKILNVVKTLKDEKGLLLWILGNENNYTFSGKIGFWTSPEIEKLNNPQEKTLKKARIYYSFVDDIARAIKRIDRVHPVALGNGEASFLNVAAKYCRHIDALAIILYRGKKFGSFFEHVRNFCDKPIFLSEFGADSWDAFKNEENQNRQAEFLLSQWKDLYKNTVFSGNEKGNCLGGIIFEWTDEWWKHNEGYTADWGVHNKEAGWSDGSYYFDIRAEGGFNMNEEWFGLISLGEEVGNINERTPKKSYHVIKEWLSEVNQNIP